MSVTVTSRPPPAEMPAAADIVGAKLGREETRHRKALLIVSLATNLGLLGFFKYYNFFVDSAADFLSFLGFHPHDATLNIILPVGISFFTFQTMSYTIDVYRRRMTPSRSFASFLLYVCFFPQLIAGPIERAGHLLSQMGTMAETRLSGERVLTGTLFIVWGLMKKTAISDNLALVADLVIRCASERKESRGLHYNVDYPHRDDGRFAVDTLVRQR